MNDDKYYYGLTSEKEIGDMFELHFLTFSISKFAHWYLSFADSATIIYLVFTTNYSSIFYKQ